MNRGNTKIYKSFHNEFEERLVLPFYHIVTNEDVPHIKHLFSFHKVEKFLADLDFLCSHYQPIDLPTLLNCIKNQINFPKHSFFLSFDDGLREVNEIIAPILLEKGIPATFFISKNFVDTKELFYRNKASLLVEYIECNNQIELNNIQEIFQDNGLMFKDIKTNILSVGYNQRHILDLIAKECSYDFDVFLKKQKPYLSSEQIKSLIKKGFTFGAHSVDHPPYSTLSLNEQIFQTSESMEYITNTFNIDYKVFAFPFNDTGVSTRFFKTMMKEKIFDLSFGTSGIIDDIVPNNLQRIWFENTDLNAMELLTKSYMEKKYRQQRGIDVIKRLFC